MAVLPSGVEVRFADNIRQAASALRRMNYIDALAPDRSLVPREGWMMPPQGSYQMAVEERLHDIRKSATVQEKLDGLRRLLQPAQVHERTKWGWLSNVVKYLTGRQRSRYALQSGGLFPSRQSTNSPTQGTNQEQ